jgi:hypothetical protein
MGILGGLDIPASLDKRGNAVFITPRERPIASFVMFERAV